MLKTNKIKERIENKHYREERESKGLKKKQWKNEFYSAKTSQTLILISNRNCQTFPETKMDICTFMYYIILYCIIFILYYYF